MRPVEHRDCSEGTGGDRGTAYNLKVCARAGAGAAGPAYEGHLPKGRFPCGMGLESSQSKNQGISLKFS